MIVNWTSLMWATQQVVNQISKWSSIKETPSCVAPWSILRLSSAPATIRYPSYSRSRALHGLSSSTWTKASPRKKPHRLARAASSNRTWCSSAWRLNLLSNCRTMSLWKRWTLNTQITLTARRLSATAKWLHPMSTATCSTGLSLLFEPLFIVF